MKLLRAPVPLGHYPHVHHKRKEASQFNFTCRSVAVSAPATVADAKKQLLGLVEGTERGLRAGKFLRGLIEEAQVNVEAYGGPELDYDMLPGLWKLEYTNAQDVIPILDAPYLLANPFGPNILEVGDIYQRFSSTSQGWVENVINLSVAGLLMPKKGITITVGAKYDVRSPHTIALTFQQAQVDGIRISSALEALLAPAILPRTSLSHTLLMGIKEVRGVMMLHVHHLTCEKSDALSAHLSVACRWFCGKCMFGE